MNESLKINFNVEKYRAIKKSEIDIDGITVVAGENGCGKSTLSKMLYYIFKISISYDLLVATDLKENLNGIFRFFEFALRDLVSVDRGLVNEMRKDIDNLYQNISSEIPNEKIRDLINFQLDRIGLILTLSDVDKRSLQRLSFVANDLIGNKRNSEILNKDLIERLKNKVNSAFESSFKLLKSRNTFLLKNELEKIFHTNTLPKKLEVFELDQILLSLSDNKLSLSYGVQNTVYIDTPMMLGEYSDDNPHWNELNEIISNNKYNNRNNSIISIIRDEILKGDVKYEDDILSSYNFTFSRKADNKIFNLLDCATGIKSFSILQMLLKLGFITDKTLIIFDEPESNLHPQWIVEFARIIVLINKNIGAKFFIASHNPDFISAIRYISEKEGNLDSVNFYLAQQEEDFSYVYEKLGKNIDPIFKSFNIALDRIEKYGI